MKIQRTGYDGRHPWYRASRLKIFAALFVSVSQPAGAEPPRLVPTRLPSQTNRGLGC